MVLTAAQHILTALEQHIINLQLDIANQLEHVGMHEDQLTDDQQDIVAEVTRRLDNQMAGIIFIDAPGG